MDKAKQFNMVKVGFTMLGTIIGNNLGIMAPAMLLLIFLMMVDYVSGMLASKKEAMQAIAKYFPLAFLALIVILVALFGNFREPVIILWHCLSLGLGRKLTFSSPVATVEFSKFAGIMSAALSQHHLSALKIAPLDRKSTRLNSSHLN